MAQLAKVQTKDIVISEPMLTDVLRNANPAVSSQILEAITKAMAASGSAVAQALQTEIQHPDPDTETEQLRGEGLGEILPSSEDGMALLHDAASLVPLDDWAGETVTPTILCERLGVSRSAIGAWRKNNDVIALPKGRKAHVYPFLQFWEGRPVQEIRDILSLTSGNALVAWRWLMTPHDDFDGTPIEALRDGEAASVMEAARRSFG